MYQNTIFKTKTMEESRQDNMEENQKKKKMQVMAWLLTMDCLVFWCAKK